MSGNAYSFIVFAGNELNNIPRHYFMGFPLDPVAIRRHCGTVSTRASKKISLC